MTARLVYRDGYPVLAPRATLRPMWGVCALSNPDHPHEGELHDGICAEDWARMVPFDIRERKRWNRDLRLWWRRWGWAVLLGLAALCYLAALLWAGAQWRQWQAVMGW